ncbi:MAG: hypothetical protein O9345_16520 [Burkholderiaceae bacterium]|jgi:hypothetical protein|nr:hypothetical protein [Burkholderiales bacterium]MCZ8098343.1 hypothetical protein [Burkholderiales bacterium]MCZ8339730.1 hypothetical protein [Burkholderiaceae bacterium]
MKTAGALTCLCLAALSPHQVLAGEDPAHPGTEHRTDDNGTDPTRVSRTVQLKFEHLALRDGFGSNTLKLWYSQPLGEGYSAIFKLPVTQVEVPGNKGAGLGDVSVQVGKVFGLTREGGHVVQGEMIFETATRPELGANQNVFKATYVRAIFLQDGSILAPSIVHNVGVWGQDDRPRVNLSTLDVYYVPKMVDPRNLVTFDPNVNYNWQNDNRFASLAVTLGRNLGKSPFGGNHFVLVKPAILVGGDRPNRWGVELTYRVIGF